MPSSRSDEMLGTRNTPNAVLSASPPPNLVLSSWFGVAWHEAQPPAQNIVRPFARSAWRGGSASAGTLTGMVTTQSAAAAATATTTRRMRNLRKRVLRRSIGARHRFANHLNYLGTPRAGTKTGGASADGPPD